MDTKIYESIVQRIDEVADTLITTSHEIHAKPELAFKEFFACDRLTGVLEEHEISSSKAVYSLNTSFEATLNPSKTKDNLTVAILAEYDAFGNILRA